MGVVTYWRYSPWHQRSAFEGSPRAIEADVAVYDVLGERGAQTLTARLENAPRGVAGDIVLRGLSVSLREDIRDGLYDQDLHDLFPNATRLLDLSVHSHPRLRSLRALDLKPAEESGLLTVIAETEVEALLHWSGAIWSPDAYHFVLPSGQHANRFIRVADIFASPVNVDRVADWCGAFLSRATFVMLDSATMLPLAQAMEIRARRAFSDARFAIRVLPLYSFPPERTRSAFAELERWTTEYQDCDPVVLSLVSVNASGGYIGRFEAGLATCGAKPRAQTIVVCNTGPEPNANVLCRIDVEPHEASLCEAPSSAVEVDQQTFTTRVLMGVTRTSLPSYRTVRDLAPMLGDLTRAGAFRVHVDRPQGDHLSVMIDTAKVLECDRFVCQANDALQSALSGWVPDLVLVPSHGGTAALSAWLTARGLTNIVSTPVGYDIPQEIGDVVRAASRILLVDDALVSSRTFRALLEVVQRIKPHLESFDVRGFVLIARTALDSTQIGFRKRFFLDTQFVFSAAWTFPLPDLGTTEHGTCPWCVERRFIESALPTMHSAARDYFEQRLARLNDPAGLSERLLLLSDHPVVIDPEAGVATTAGSYLGAIPDIGAYVFLASLVQRVRYVWQREITLYDKRHVLSLDGEMRFYTDSVIAGSLLRTANPGEVWSVETSNSLGRAIVEIEHPHQHAVLAAEVLFAVNRRKLPSTIPLQGFIAPHSPAIQAVLRELVRSV